MFSPYYKWAGRARPENHCAINVALYGPRARWTMTERGAGKLARDADALEVGASRMRWTGESLIVEIDERAVPHLSRVRGRVRLTPDFLTDREAALDPAGAHVWRPFAPAARVEVEMEAPAQSWRGHAYMDANFGARPLEADFGYWTWSRGRGAGGASVLYDAERRDGTALQLSGRFSPSGAWQALPPPPMTELPGTLWRVRRRTRADADAPAQVTQRMEDAPFYARAGLRARLWGEEVEGVHEALDLDRFDTPWCRALLPWRMPRLA